MFFLGSMSSATFRSGLARFAAACAVACLWAQPAVAQPATAAGPDPSNSVSSQVGALFPEPFLVEHHLVQTDGDGTRFEVGPVTDYYGGSWIVSVRPDGSRRVVDLARREITEVQPERGTFWTLSFDRHGDLAARLARAQRRGGTEPVEAREDAPAGRAAAAAGSTAARSAATPGGELVVEDLPAPAAAASRRAGSGAEESAGFRPGVRRLRVVARDRADDPDAGIEVWVDPSVRLRPAAVQALAAFEETLVGRRRGGATDDGSDGGNGGAAGASLSHHLAAARSHAGGAVPVRTSRRLDAGPGSAPGRLEDVVTRLEPLEEFPRDLLTIPEGLVRVPHPMEAVVVFLEDEAERDRAMAGATGAAGDRR